VYHWLTNVIGRVKMQLTTGQEGDHEFT